MTDTADTPRRTALEALLRIDEGAFAHILVPDMLRRRRFDTRDRALVTELVYGSVRMQRTVDYLLAKVSSRPLTELEPRVRAALRLGAYQLLIGIPSHAAVSETVNLVSARVRGFVNGVLRALARLGPEWPLPTGSDPESIAIRTSHPDWIVGLLIDSFGAADAITTLELDDEPPPVTLRVNRMQTEPERVASELRDAGMEVARGTLVPDALVVRHSGDLAAVPAIRDGRVTPQDQSSQAIVGVLDPQPGDRVLDVAAAPGGKATAAAERMHGDGIVVAADLHRGRAGTIARAALRLELQHTIAPIVANGSHPPVRDGMFDRVLLDAPCSGLGVLRRRPDARWRVQPSAVEQLAVLQRELLAAAWRAVRPGGRLVYSVCTVTPAETLEIDAWAAASLPEFVAVAPPGAPWRAHGRGALLLPSDAGTDGMFVLVGERRRALSPPPASPAAAVAADPVPAATEPAATEPAADEPPPRRWARVE